MEDRFIAGREESFDVGHGEGGGPRASSTSPQKMARSKKLTKSWKMQENEDAKEDQIRQMAWFALWGMLLYPLGIFVTSFFGLDDAAGLISDIAPTYFVAIAGLVAAFFGANAYAKGKSNSSDDDY